MNDMFTLIIRKVTFIWFSVFVILALPVFEMNDYFHGGGQHSARWMQREREGATEKRFLLQLFQSYK